MHTHTYGHARRYLWWVAEGLCPLPPGVCECAPTRTHSWHIYTHIWAAGKGFFFRVQPPVFLDLAPMPPMQTRKQKPHALPRCLTASPVHSPATSPAHSPASMASFSASASFEWLLLQSNETADGKKKRREPNDLFSWQKKRCFHFDCKKIVWIVTRRDPCARGVRGVGKYFGPFSGVGILGSFALREHHVDGAPFGSESFQKSVWWWKACLEREFVHICPK